MTILEAATRAHTSATILLADLAQRGLTGQLHRPIQYGHKFSVLDPAGLPFHAILYVGAQGPRLVAEGRAWPVDLWRTVTASFASSVAGSRPTADRPPLVTQPTGSTIIYVDGSYLASDPQATVGWAFEVWQDGQSLHQDSGSFDDHHTAGINNVAGECYAVLAALDWCALHQITTIELRYDYTGLAQWAMGTWHANTPITQEYATRLQSAPVQILWTKIDAHRGEPGNSRVDAAARHAAANRVGFTEHPTHLPNRLVA